MKTQVNAGVLDTSPKLPLHGSYPSGSAGLVCCVTEFRKEGLDKVGTHHSHAVMVTYLGRTGFPAR
jgi:hypothetical protein